MSYILWAAEIVVTRYLASYYAPASLRLYKHSNARNPSYRVFKVV